MDETTARVKIVIDSTCKQTPISVTEIAVNNATNVPTGNAFWRLIASRRLVIFRLIYLPLASRRCPQAREQTGSIDWLSPSLKMSS